MALIPAATPGALAAAQGAPETLVEMSGATPVAILAVALAAVVALILLVESSKPSRRTRR